MKIAVFTVSDRCYKNIKEDGTGPAIKNIIKKQGWKTEMYEIIPDEKNIIKQKLLSATKNNIDLVFTAGGTGPGKRDVTPEATMEVIEKQIPGISEIMRIESYKKTKFSVLSRGVCGILNNTLIINLPGSIKGAVENLEILLPIIPHTIKVMNGSISDCTEDIK